MCSISFVLAKLKLAIAQHFTSPEPHQRFTRAMNKGIAVRSHKAASSRQTIVLCPILEPLGWNHRVARRLPSEKGFRVWFTFLTADILAERVEKYSPFLIKSGTMKD